MGRAHGNFRGRIAYNGLPAGKRKEGDDNVSYQEQANTGSLASKSLARPGGNGREGLKNRTSRAGGAYGKEQVVRG